MQERKIHILTVQTGHNWNRHSSVPMLTLKGKWLEEVGFTPNTKVEVIRQDDGSLLICPINKAQSLTQS